MRGTTARQRLAAAVVLCAALSPITPFAAGASELPGSPSGTQPGTAAPAEATEPVLAGKVALPDAYADVASTLGAMAAWPWPERGEALLLGQFNGTAGGFQRAAALDLRDKRLVREVAFPAAQPAWATKPPNSIFSYGQPHTAVLDRNGGRFFVAYSRNAPSTPNVAGAAGWAGATAAGASGAAQGEVVCAVPVDVMAAPCLGGVHVLDAASLDLVRSIPLRALRVDGGAVLPVPRAFSYAPPRAPSDAGKLLLLVEDLLTSPASQNTTVATSQPRSLGMAVHYAVQLDPETGQQDWAVRVDGCTGAREDSLRYAGTREDPYPAAIFRSPDPAAPAVWVGCTGAARTGTAVRIPLDGDGDPLTASQLSIEQPDTPSAAQAGPDDAVAGLEPPATAEVFVGPDKVGQVLADPVSQRLVMKVVDAGQESWWVFDGRRREFLGVIGIGAQREGETRAGLDEATGRFYVLAPDKQRRGNGGLYVGELRGEGLGQALRFETADGAFATLAATGDHFPLVPARAAGGDATDVFTIDRSANALAVIRDARPPQAGIEESDFAGRTLDLDEIEGVTQAAFDGAARGYGARVLLVAGAEGTTRAGPVDVLGSVRGAQSFARNEAPSRRDTVPAVDGLRDEVPPPDTCTNTDRQLVLAFVGPEAPAVVEAGGSRASADPLIADSATRADSGSPVSRCSPLDWQRVWTTALFGQAPVPEPAVAWPLGPDSRATCVSGEGSEPGAGQGSTSQTGDPADPLRGAFSARVDCDTETAGGWSQARTVTVDGVHVAEAMSSFRVYRDPGRGLVSRIESVTRGVDVAGLVRIGLVRAQAESWANGRRQRVDAAERAAGYDPNCDFDRTAGSCFTRSIAGVWTPEYACGHCGHEQEVVDAIARALGTSGRVRLRQPDPRLAKGAENGFIAAIQKPDHERFADLTLNSDLLQTTLPALEIVRFAPQSRQLPEQLGAGPRGRQVIQLAGVEVSSSYGIQCLLVYDKDTGTCAAAKEPPGSITVALADADGKPLAGGAFEVRRDVDGDGVAGLKDVLLSGGACVTAADGVGTCTFTDLAPGGYLVAQVAAPAGYGKIADPFTVELASGEARTVTFTNTTNVSVVQVKATDEAGKPVSGAVFAVYPDPDADGKVTAGATPAATCTTGIDGTCTMTVPAGSYVLVQTAAPAGLEVIDPVAFTLASAGQTAAVGVTNYPLGVPAPPAPATGPVPVYRDPAPAPVVETVDTSTPPPPADTATAPRASLPQAVSGTIVRVIAAPGDTLRLLARSPKEALAWIASLALFTAAALVVLRRQHTLALIRGE